MRFSGAGNLRLSQLRGASTPSVEKKTAAPKRSTKKGLTTWKATADKFKVK